MSHDVAQPKRVVAIGLEAAEPRLIERWCAEGLLPHIEALQRRGNWRRVLSSTDVSSGSTWASIITGTTPAKHGVGFYHRQLRTGTYEIRKLYADEIARDPFWFELARRGRRVAVFDLPEIYPVAGFNGKLLVGWGAEAPNYRRSSWPAEYIDQVSATYGRHPMEGWYQARPTSPSGWAELRDRLLWGVETRGKILLDLLAEEPWDLMIGGVAETHWAGHFFWHFLEPDHPDHDPALATQFADAMLEVYQATDRVVGQLAEAAGDAAFLVFSNTGMGPNYSGLHLVPQILEKLGYAGTSAAAKRGWLPGARWGTQSVKRVEELVGTSTIERVKRLVPERTWDTWTRRLLNAGSGWSRSRAFSVPSDYTANVRINLQGREPSGTVPTGDYDAVCEDLTAAFEELVNPRTGKPAVSRVFKTRELYTGDRIDDLPDLLVRWTGDAAIEALHSPRFGAVSSRLGDKRSGAHQPFGYLLACGSAFNGAGAQLPDADIHDIATTICHVMGEPAAADLDGGILHDSLR